MENTRLTKEELFLKIIEKAEKNGFSLRKEHFIEKVEYIGFGRFIIKFSTETEDANLFEFHINELIFNHNFAKAFFGTKDSCENCKEPVSTASLLKRECQNCGTDLNEKNVLEIWKIQIKEMVVESDVFIFLEKFINS